MVVLVFKSPSRGGRRGGIRRRMLNRGKTVFIGNLYHSPDGLVAGLKAFIRHHELKGNLGNEDGKGNATKQ